MIRNYEAVVVTTDSTFRAAANQIGIEIREDGIPGITAQIDLDEIEFATLSPEGLMQKLIIYVYEFERGLDILSATLKWRT